MIDPVSIVTVALLGAMTDSLSDVYKKASVKFISDLKADIIKIINYK